MAEVTGLNCLNSMELQEGRGGGWGWGVGRRRRQKRWRTERLFVFCFLRQLSEEVREEGRSEGINTEPNLFAASEL